MKRIGVVVLTIALAGVGCSPALPKNVKPPEVRLEKSGPPAVMAEDITEKNFEEKTKAFREEMESELGTRATAEPE